MRIFYDLEFLEDGRTIDLISIGMVREDGHELYCVNQAIEDNPLHDRIRNHRWLMANVVPHLPLRERDPMPKHSGSNAPQMFFTDDTSQLIMPLRMIRNAVRAFVLDAGPEVELWADYGAYDHVALCQLFGTMMALPKGFPMWTHDLRQEMERYGVTDEELPARNGDEHHALGDAHHLMACYVFMSRRLSDAAERLADQWRAERTHPARVAPLRVEMPLLAGHLDALAEVVPDARS